jgi:hypothetical protein
VRRPLSALALLSAFACCSPATSNSDPCDGCPVACFTERQCDSQGVCSDVHIGCTESCAANADCGDGKACVPFKGALSCDPRCQSALCPGDLECSTFGACMPVSCGVKPQNACPKGQYCGHQHCYEADGTCSRDGDCESDGRISSVATVGCSSGTCHLTPVGDSEAPLATSATSAASRIEVDSPSRGQTFATADAVEIRWKPTAGVALVLVYDGLPVSSADMARRAIWGFASPAGGDPVARWRDGLRVQGGAWGGSPAAPPMGRPLYVLVQGVQKGVLQEISRMVPFAVGLGWKAVGDACAESDSVPGSCDNPEGPRACIGHVCRRLCAAHVDCPTGQLCGVSAAAPRFCQ